MKCRRCNDRESTGFLIHLCDICFDEWEANLKRTTADGSKYEVPEDEASYFVEQGRN